jgi:hypothetical protein
MTIIHDMPEGKYHGDTSRDSHSLIEAFLRRRSEYPKLRAGKRPRRTVTDEMYFGRYFHALAMEGKAAADARFLVGPSRLDVGQAKPDDPDAHTVCNRVRKEGKAAWADFEARCEREHKEPVLPHLAQRAATMLTALADHSEAGELLFPLDAGTNEVVIEWTEPTSGRPCRSRLDRLLLERRLAPDLKTYNADADSRTPDPHRMTSQAYRFGYHRQAAFYIDALYAETRHWFRMPFIFVSAEDEPKVFVWWSEPDSPEVSIGRHEYQSALVAIAECERTGDWRQPFEIEREQPFRLPAWVMREHERLFSLDGVESHG